MPSQPTGPHPDKTRSDDAAVVRERLLPTELPLRFLAPALSLIAVFVFVGLIVYRHELRQNRADAVQELQSVSRLKVEQLTSWLDERRGNGEIARAQPLVRRLLADPSDVEARAAAKDYFELLRRLYGYAEVGLFDAEGRPILVIPPGTLETHACAPDHVRRSLEANTVIVEDLHRAGPESQIRLAISGAVLADPKDPGSRRGVVLLALDPARFLYPFLTSWAVPTRTSETLLVRRDGDEVVYLNPLRHKPDAALNLKLPIRRDDVPAVRAAAQGRRGDFSGVDYHGDPVVAYASDVPGTRWLLIAKTGESEVLKPARDAGLTISGVAALAALCALLGTVAIWRQHTFRLAAKAMHKQARTEADLRHSEAQLSEALRLAKAGNWEYDVATDQFTFNDNFYRVFRTTAEAVGGYTMSSRQYAERFCHPEDAPLVGLEVAEGLNNTAPEYKKQIDHRILFPDGTTGYIAVRIIAVKDTENRTVRTRGVNQDITERRRAEQEMSQLATAVEQSAEMVLIADDHGRIQYINPAFERTSGYSREEVIGRTRAELWANDVELEIVAQMRAAALAGQVWQGHFANKRKDGSRYDEEAVISPVRDAGGRVTNYVVVSRDITARLEMERHLRQAQKLEGIGHLAGGVAHDFNNILAAMMMQIGVLLEESDLTPDVIEGMRDVEAYANRAAALTRQLLLFSRRSVMQKLRLDMNEVLHNLLKMLLRILGEHISIETQIEERLPPIEADPGMVEQVIMNLAINARDAMEGGGKLRFATRVATFTESDVAKSPQRRRGTFVCLEVQDHGTGMDEKTMARIFEPFFTTKGVGRGTGLGLATVYGIVAQHAGFIEVESEVGKGTTFRVYWPATEGDLKSDPETGRTRPIVRGHETILLVEDDASVRGALEKLLTHAGYRVFEAASGPAAVTLWEARSGQIDLLFSDMVMPEGMSGLDLARRLRRDRPDLPVIISSGYSADLAAQGDLRASGIVFVRKPSAPGEVAATVRKCLDRQPLSQTPRVEP